MSAASPPPSSAAAGWRWGAVLAAAWLVLALFLLPSYGPTWDETVGEFPYGEGLLRWAVARDVSLEQTLVHPVALPTRAPHPDFRFEQPWTDVWPLASFLSAASCQLLWSGLGVLEPVAAHHLPAPLFVAVLAAVLVAWLARRAGLLAGIAAALALLASPRFFADGLTNLKDAPEAVLYVLAWLALPRALERATWRAFALVGLLAAAALAQKANALFLAPQGLLLLLAWRPLSSSSSASRGEPPADGAAPIGWGATLRGLVVAAAVFVAAYFALSPQLWIDPLDHVARMYRHILENGNRITQDALFDMASDGARRAIDWDGVQQVLWTTPPTVLLLALLGLFAPRLSRRDRFVLLLGVAVPLGRTLLPGNVNFDGVRHYLEFMPCLALLAGAGVVTLADLARRVLPRAAASGAALALAVVPGAVAVARTHPNGTAYFNAFVGGLAGAQARGVRDATDYWGNSYWQALAWLDDHAEPGAALLVPVSPQIVRSVANCRLRGDLKLARVGGRPPNGPLYVAYVTRRDWYDRALRELDAENAPIHAITVDGAPILKILRFDAGAPTAAAHARLTASHLGGIVRSRVADWLLKNRARRAAIADLFAHPPDGGDAALVAKLRELLPPELHQGLEEMVREVCAPR